MDNWHHFRIVNPGHNFGFDNEEVTKAGVSGIYPLAPVLYFMQPIRRVIAYEKLFSTCNQQQARTARE